MKEKVEAPCEHFDMLTNFARKGALCYENMACSYYDENLTADDAEYDPQGPCKRKNTAYADTRTIEIFGGLNEQKMR